jgi:hypothetical protein
MLAHIKIKTDDKKKASKAYHCVSCGTYITNSAATVEINGSEDHSFVNPVGIQCNFHTFIECENIRISDEIFLQHSWFPGYGWRFLVCGACSLHLGWKYDAMAGNVRPKSFFGVLISSVEEQEQGS